MQKAVLEKFLQNPDMRASLIQTEEAELIEATQYDSWWGSGLPITDDHDQGYPGLSKMGRILGSVRGCLKDFVKCSLYE